MEQPGRRGMPAGDTRGEGKATTEAPAEVEQPGTQNWAAGGAHSGITLLAVTLSCMCSPTLSFPLWQCDVSSPEPHCELSKVTQQSRPSAQTSHRPPAVTQ